MSLLTTHFIPQSGRDAWAALQHDPKFRERGCGPSAGDPMRAAGNPELSIDAWSASTEDGGMPHKVRRAIEAAAIEVCVECPLMVACARYGSAVDERGRLVEPHGILGGETASERAGRYETARESSVPSEAPDQVFGTKQKRAILFALARHADARDVATVAGMDLRTANWHRSKLATDLGLAKTVSRNEVLQRALERGLVKSHWLRLDDGTVPAVVRDMKVTAEPAPKLRRTIGRRPDRSKFTNIAGQLGLPRAVARRAMVTTLPSVPAKRLEAAA